MLGATRGTGCPHWLRGLQAPSEGTGLFFRDSRDTALPSKNVGGNVQPQRSTAPWSHQMGQRPGVLPSSGNPHLAKPVGATDVFELYSLFIVNENRWTN